MRVRRYETVFVLRPDLEESKVEEIISRLEGVITGDEGIIVKREDWGIRRLAYQVNHYPKGHYFLLDYVGPTRLVNELERIIKINEDIMKFLTVKKSDRVNMEEIEKEKEEEERRMKEGEKVAGIDVGPEEHEEGEEIEQEGGESEEMEEENPEDVPEDHKEPDDQDSPEEEDKDK